MRFRLRTLLIALAVGPLILAIAANVPMVTWSGGFDLEVRLVNDTQKIIARIEAANVWRRRDADLVVDFPHYLSELTLKQVHLTPDGRGEIFVRSGGKVGCWTGVEWSYRQAEALVIQIHFDDGTSSLIAVDTPRRGVRQMEVRIPEGE